MQYELVAVVPFAIGAMFSVLTTLIYRDVRYTHGNARLRNTALSGKNSEDHPSQGRGDVRFCVL